MKQLKIDLLLILVLVTITLCGTAKQDSLKTYTLPTVYVIVEKPSEAIGSLHIIEGEDVKNAFSLREAMQKNHEKLGWNIYIPKFEYTTDNAAMIAMVAKLKYERSEFTDLRTTATSKYDL